MTRRIARCGGTVIVAGLLGACPAGEDDGGDTMASVDTTAADPGTTADDHGATSWVDGSSSAAPGDSTDTGAPADDGTSTGQGDVCVAFCETIVPCEAVSADACASECEALLRFAADHFGTACQAAHEASLVCIGGLTCAEHEAFACEETEIDETVTCQGDLDPGPSIVAFCDSQVACDVPVGACQLAFLDDFMREAYRQGCEVQYAALLACVAPLGCMSTEMEQEAACGAEIDALNAVCSIFG